MRVYIYLPVQLLAKTGVLQLLHTPSYSSLVLSCIWYSTPGIASVIRKERTSFMPCTYMDRQICKHTWRWVSRCVKVWTMRNSVYRLLWKVNTPTDTQQLVIQHAPVRNEMRTWPVCIWAHRWDRRSCHEISRRMGDSRWPSVSSPAPPPVGWTHLMEGRASLRRQEGKLVSNY